MKRKIQLLLFVLLVSFFSANAQSKKEKGLEVLVERAKKAGLDDERIHKFLELISQKEKGFEEIRNSSNDENVFGILESPIQKTHHEVKMEFAKNLANLISKEEYLAILEDEIMKEARKEAAKEWDQILINYELTNNQKKKVYALIALYYMNKSVTTAYYVYDYKLKQQKLSVLKFYFEKNYEKLMAGYGIEIGASKKADNNTFQY